MIVPHDQIMLAVQDLHKAGGLPKGSSTGWAAVDKLYTVAMGQWTLVTGSPGSGKSEWVDALIVNLAKREEWKFVIYSPENWPLALHHSKILEKYLGKPFNPGPTERISEEEIEEGEEWMRGKFLFAKPEAPNLTAILSEVAQHFHYPVPGSRSYKVGCVIDPWNQLEHYRPAAMSETEYVSHALSEMIRFCREAEIHCWLVAHPSKLQRNREGKLPIPTPHDVSGSAHFWNKADNCICVWRDMANESSDVDIHVQKVRFKHIGRIGLATLRYDRVTGQYFDPGAHVYHLNDRRA